MLIDMLNELFPEFNFEPDRVYLIKDKGYLFVPSDGPLMNKIVWGPSFRGIHLPKVMLIHLTPRNKIFSEGFVSNRALDDNKVPDDLDDIRSVTLSTLSIYSNNVEVPQLLTYNDNDIKIKTNIKLDNYWKEIYSAWFACIVRRTT